MNLSKTATLEFEETGQLQLVIKHKYSSKRIDKYLVSRLQDYSRSSIQRLIKEEAVKVNNSAVKSNYEIKLNDAISIQLPTRYEKVHKHLALQFEERTIKKEYLAVVKGEPELDSDKIDLPIGKDKRDRKKMAIRHDTGKNAVSIFEVIERFPGYTLVRVMLETGRTHQIRVHMKTIGHPVIADSEYGDSDACCIEDLTKPVSNKDIHSLAKLTELCNNTTDPIIERQALHAYKIGFTHPVSNKAMEFTAEIPKDMHNLITTLRKIKALLN